MRKQAWAMMLAAAASGGSITAAEPADPVQAVKFEYDNYYRQGDENVAASPAYLSDSGSGCTLAGCDTTVGCCDACTCGSACAAGGLFSGCTLAGPIEGFSLANLIGAQGTGLDVGGWTETVYMNHNVPLSTAYNDGQSFDDVPHHAHIGQQWFYLGHVADGSNGIGFGGRFDVVYGTDAQKTQGFGNPGSAGTPPGTFARNAGSFDASWDNGEYGWAIPQLYGEVAAGDFSVKIGHFLSNVGFETVPVTGNFFRSRSYTMFNSEPLTQTGVLSTYRGYENLTLYGGWALGWDTGFNQLNQGNLAIGGFAYNLSDYARLSYISNYGNFGWRDGGDNNSYSHSIVLTMDLTDRLMYVAQSDNVRTNNPGVSAFDTIGLNQYLIYKFNDVLSAGGRVEWWKADGISYNEATGGVNIKALSNLVFRPEVRHDWSPGANIDQTTFLVDGVWTY
jgi:hypothetical protein